MSTDLKISAAARKLAEENQIDIASIIGTGNDGAITVENVKTAIAAKAPKSEPPVEETPKSDENEDINVADPEALRPKVLPLVVTPKSGAWANEAQEEYALILNAYAYKNPLKWKKKKEGLLKNLRALVDEPELISVFKGEPQDPDAPKIEYKNHITQPK